MKLPSEIVVESFLPTFRYLLAEELSERGFTQNEIADCLGVSQPAVSKYVSGEVELEDAVADDERVAETAERLADGFGDGTLDEYEALTEVVALVRTLEDRGPICEIHERESPFLRGTGCDICVRGGDSELLAENETLHDVRRAVRHFENIPGVSEYVPNVGTNIAQALSEAEETTDVAAVPGRVYSVQGRVHVPANPEFGASKNVATVALTAMEADDDRRGAVNIATTDEVLRKAEEAGMTSVEFDPQREEREKELKKAFDTPGTTPDIVYHTGAFGVEPVAYVVAEDAPNAVEKLDSIIS